MTKFVNLTPHPVRLRVNAANTAAEPDPSDIIVEPYKGLDGKPAPARVASTPGGVVGDAAGIPIYSAPAWGEVQGLPGQPWESEHDVLYIVSLLVLERVRAEGALRSDVVGPGTGPADGAVRYGDDAGARKGQVYAVTRLNAL